MITANRSSALILGLFLLLGLSSLGALLGKAALDYKQLDRTVTVKGLSEREYQADIVIWPVSFAVASNDLESLYTDLDRNASLIRDFLVANGIQSEEISYSSPTITDRSAQQYGGDNQAEFRYVASRTVTVYSGEIETVRAVMNQLPELGKRGIVLTEGDFQFRTEYLFTRLNEVKPGMIEEATRNAREVAEKFAEDSESRLGKIRKAKQGQFSISARDQNNPHIKKVRVVSTVEYYLSD